MSDPKPRSTQSSSSQPMHPQPSDSRRDDLALIRTDLANERTLLAYGRTALMVGATGITLIKFFPEIPEVHLIGWGLVTAGVFVGITGVIRFAKLSKRLHRS